MKNVWVSHLIVFLLLVACSPAAEQPSEESNTDGNDSSPALLSVTNTPLPEGKETLPNTSDDVLSRDDVGTAVLLYERSGGLKGVGPSVSDWQFYGDGRIVSSDGNSWRVEPERIDNLVAEITASGFQSLESNYVPEDTCCDRAFHLIIVRTAEKTHTVETLDGAEMPQSLKDNIQQINIFLSDLYE